MEPKKTAKADLTRRTFLFFNVGLVTALLLCIFAFTFKTADEHSGIDLTKCTLPPIDEPPIDVPITTVTPPPPPPIIQPVFKEVKNTDPVKEISVVVDLGDPIIERVPDVYVPPVIEPEPEDPKIIHTFLEESASPAGGLPAFYQYVSKTIKYPSQARRMETEGRVFVQFVVEPDGTLSNVEAIQGIGAGCDEEAVRVLKTAPKWNPGKQRGKAVRQRIVLPIYFKLQ